jgi:hypothetical protein
MDFQENNVTSSGFFEEFDKGEGKYWWMKLPEGYFNKPEIILIELQPDDDRYVYFYFKLLALWICIQQA